MIEPGAPLATPLPGIPGSPLGGDSAIPQMAEPPLFTAPQHIIVPEPDPIPGEPLTLPAWAILAAEDFARGELLERDSEAPRLLLMQSARPMLGESMRAARTLKVRRLGMRPVRLHLQIPLTIEELTERALYVRGLKGANEEPAIVAFAYLGALPRAWWVSALIGDDATSAPRLTMGFQGSPPVI